EASATTSATDDEPQVHPATFDFFPGAPDLANFPRQQWLRALRETLSGMPYRDFAYPDPQGAQELRRVLAEHLRRGRGAAARPLRGVVFLGLPRGPPLLP